MTINLATLQIRIAGAINANELSACIFTGTKTFNIHQVLLDNQNEITNILAADTRLGNILPADRGLLQLAGIPGILPADLMTIINHPNTNAAVLNAVVANAASNAASDTAVLGSGAVAGLSTASLTLLATRTLNAAEFNQIADHANANDPNVINAILGNAALVGGLDAARLAVLAARVAALGMVLTPAKAMILNPAAPVVAAPPVVPVALPVIDQVANAAEAFLSAATQAKIIDARGIGVALIPDDRWNALEAEYLQPIADANPLGLPAVIDPALGQQFAEAARKFEVMLEATETIQQARAGQTVTVASPEKAKEIVAQGGLQEVASKVSLQDGNSINIITRENPAVCASHIVSRFWQ